MKTHSMASAAAFVLAVGAAILAFPAGSAGAAVTEDETKPAFLRLNLDFGIGLSSIPRFITGARDVPASIRWLPTILSEPHLVAKPNAETRTTMLFTLRAAPRIRIGPFSLGAGIEHPANFESILLDERAVYSLENFDAWYEAVLREKTRTFVEAGFHPDETLRIGVGWMTSRLVYEFRSGNDKTTYIPSDYYFVAEHYVDHGVYKTYEIAREAYDRFYAFIEYAEESLDGRLCVSYGKNPFAGKTYLWEGAPLNLVSGPANAVTISFTVGILIGP
jgi:hypothetical protein